MNRSKSAVVLAGGVSGTGERIQSGGAGDREESQPDAYGDHIQGLLNGHD